MVYELDKKYQWRKGGGYSIPADVVAKNFNDIEKNFGEVTAENVLNAARSEASELHSCFEWNDGIAAEKYRLSQAGHMIVNLCVVRTSQSEDTAKNIVTRAYVNVSSAGERRGRFVNEEKAMSDVEMRAFVLKQALRELEIFKAKYENLMELASLFEEIEILEAKLAS